MMTDQHLTHWLQLKTLLRDVHPAVWRRVRLVDGLSIADLHYVIQVLMGWEDDHLHRFRIHGRDYGIAYIGGPIFAEDAWAVPLSRFGFRPSERFLYEYDFTAGWQIEVRVERVISATPGASHCIPVCVDGRGVSPPDNCGGPRAYAEQRRDALGWPLAADVDAVVAVLQRVADGDDTVLDDPAERCDFERAVPRLKAREPFLAEKFSRVSVNAALREAFTAARGSP
jgi:hypothetical protein